MDDDTLIVEDLMLLLLDDASGAIPTAGTLHYSLGGAMLVDLALRGLVEVDETRSRLSGGLVSAVEGTVETAELTDPLLREAHELVSRKPKGVQTLLIELGSDLHQPVLDRLIERGMIRAAKRRLLGFIPTTALPIDDGTHEAALLESVRGALEDGAEVDAHTSAVIALVSASGALPSLHPGIRWSGAVYTRGKEYETGSWGASAVTDAVTRTAIAIAMSSVAVSIATTTAATTSS